VRSSARDRRHAARVDRLGVRMSGGDLRVRADGGDPAIADGDRGVLDDPAFGIDRHRGRVADRERGHADLAMRR
jgi:hypothetical protein